MVSRLKNYFCTHIVSFYNINPIPVNHFPFHVGFLILFPLIPVVVASAVTSVMLVLVSFIIITLVCTRKFRRKDVQVINSREAVYDEVHDQRVQQDQPDHKVVLKENAAYGQLTML